MGSNEEIWKGCCNQSLESSALKEGFSTPNNQDANLVQFMSKLIPKSEGFSLKE